MVALIFRFTPRPFKRLLKNAFHRHFERSEESFFDQSAKKREIPHPGEAHGAHKSRFADSVRNDEFEVFSKL